MAQVFKESANTLARLALGGLVVGAIVLGGVGSAFYWSPITTQVGINKAQPVPFSHHRHVTGNGLDCRYCHTSVENSKHAGIPPTETCMTCHSQILTDQPMFQPVHDSWKSGEAMEWTKVYDLPDFTYFDHSVHVAKGVGCTTCHGDIGEMRLTKKANTLFMAWCLDCHRNPQKFIRPKEEVFNPDWTPPSNQLEQGMDLVEKYHVNVGQLDNCSICHR